MSLYNMIMGRNPFGPYLMGFLGFVQGAPQNAWLGCFRDVYTNDAGDRIFMLHRNYPESDEFNQAIKAHPNFVAYIPDSDNTYGVWEFTVPEQYAEAVREIALLSDNTPLMDRYRKLIDDMGRGFDNDATRNAIEAGKKVLGPVLEAIEAGQVPDGVTEQVVNYGDGSVIVARVGVPKKND